jgi:hypothetical protein
MRPDVLVELPDWLKAVATLQSILGIALLFLFGLGILNTVSVRPRDLVSRIGTGAAWPDGR